MDLQDKHLLMVGYRGKQSHWRSAVEQGAKFDLLIDASEMQERYRDEFAEVHVLEDLFDWRQIEPIITQKNYDGVFTRLEDFTVLVSAIAEHQSLPSVKLDDALKFRNKYLMRQAFAEHNVPSADFVLVQKPEDAAAFVKKHQFPLIVKQISGIHSKYVAKVDNQQELERTINFFFEALAKEDGTLHRQLHHYPNLPEAPDHFTHLLVEECLSGEELTVDSFVVDGQVHHTPVCKYIMAEDIGIQDHHLPIRTMPYDLTDEELVVIHQVVEQSYGALGANYCVTHAEVFFNRATKDCRLIEVAARGGGFRAEMTKETCNGDYDLGIVRAALGLQPQVTNRPSCYVAVAEVFSPENGVLESIDINCLQNQPDVSHITWNTHEGGQVGLASDGRSFILKFLVKADSYDAAQSRAQDLLLQIRNSIKIDS